MQQSQIVIGCANVGACGPSSIFDEVGARKDWALCLVCPKLAVKAVKFICTVT